MGLNEERCLNLKDAQKRVRGDWIAAAAVLDGLLGQRMAGQQRRRLHRVHLHHLLRVHLCRWKASMNKKLTHKFSISPYHADEIGGSPAVEPCKRDGQDDVIGLRVAQEQFAALPGDQPPRRVSHQHAPQDMLVALALQHVDANIHGLHLSERHTCQRRREKKKKRGQ